MVDNLRWARPGARLDETHLSDTGTVRSNVRVDHDLGGSSVFEEKITPQVSELAPESWTGLILGG